MPRWGKRKTAVVAAYWNERTIPATSCIGAGQRDVHLTRATPQERHRLQIPADMLMGGGGGVPLSELPERPIHAGRGDRRAMIRRRGQHVLQIPAEKILRESPGRDRLRRE